MFETPIFCYKKFAADDIVITRTPNITLIRHIRRSTAAYSYIRFAKLKVAVGRCPYMQCHTAHTTVLIKQSSLGIRGMTRLCQHPPPPPPCSRMNRVPEHVPAGIVYWILVLVVMVNKNEAIHLLPLPLKRPVLRPT